MRAAEDVERHITVVAVIAVEEAPLLTAVQRVVGGVEVQPDLPRRFGVRLHEHVHQQAVHRLGVRGDTLVAVRAPPRRRPVPGGSAYSNQPAQHPGLEGEPARLSSGPPCPQATPTNCRGANPRGCPGPRSPARAHTPAARLAVVAKTPRQSESPGPGERPSREAAPRLRPK